MEGQKLRPILVLFIILCLVSSISPLVMSDVSTLSFSYQSPVIKEPDNLVWNKTYGHALRSDSGYCIKQTNDEGYILVGCVDLTYAQTGDVGLYKLDIDGNIEWNKTYGGIWEQYGHDVIETSDNGFLITGYFGESQTGPYDCWVIKTDSSGNMEWEYKFSRETPDVFGEKGIEVSDGYVILALSYTPSSDKDIWLIKLDFDGDEMWVKTVSEGTEDICSSFIETSDNEFVIVGYTDDFLSESGYNVLLIKTDSEGNVIWRNDYSSDRGFDIIEDVDGGYIVTGGDDFFIMKTDYYGVFLWRKEYNIGGLDKCRAVDRTTDNGFILAGQYDTNNNDAEGIIMKTDGEGNRLWQNIFGGRERQVISDVIQSNDDTYVVLGTTSNYHYDILVAKFAPFENNRPDTPEIIDGTTSGKIDTIYNYSASSTDSDNQNITCYFDWGDDYASWSETVQSGETVSVSHSWSRQGDYHIQVMAVDEYGGASDWSSLEVSMPNYKPYLTFLQEHFPLFFRGLFF